MKSSDKNLTLDTKKLDKMFWDSQKKELKLHNFFVKVGVTKDSKKLAK